MTTLVPAGTDVWVPAVLIMVGIVGIVVPVIPGLFVTVLGVLLWAYETGTSTAWVIFASVVAVYAVGLVTQFLIPGRRLRRQGVGTPTLLLAVGCAVVGFFVIPVIGFVLGFIGGIFAVEYARSRETHIAWARTRSALRAVLTSMGIELLAGATIAALFVLGVVLT